jgi:hypothetical protein
MKYKLTEEQEQAYNKLMEFCKQPYGDMFLLEGYAGTGKTFLICRLIDYFVKSNMKAIITCPTHKAVKVLYNESGKLTNKNILFTTIHSALGLQEVIDGYGVQSFVPTTNSKPKLGNYQYCIIDEVSMLDDTLFHQILPYVDNGLKVIFVGDPCQIPPVNRMDCIPFTEHKQKRYDIKKFNLYQIVRQAVDNPIINSTLKIRENLLNDKILSLFYGDKILDGEGLHIIHDVGNDNIAVLEKIVELFTDDEFDKDTDFVKLIAWRNETIDLYNSIIRNILYGDNIPKLVVNEKLIVDKPILSESGTTIILNTNEELTVKEFEIDYEYVNFGKNKIYFYKTVVESISLFGDKVYNTIKIITEDSQALYNDSVQQLKQLALQERQGSEKAKMKWIQYYDFQNTFAQVKYAYCLTSHKAQGSTYKNTIVIGWDIVFNNKIEERNRILYTACSRPKHNLYLVK